LGENQNNKLIFNMFIYMDFKKKYIKYKLKYLNSKKILSAGSEKVSEKSSEKVSENNCLFIGQGDRGFCWLATSVLVLYKLIEKGVELKQELEDFVLDTLLKFETPEKFNDSCPIIPRSLGLTEKFKEEHKFIKQLEFIDGSYLDENFDDPNIFEKLYPDNQYVKIKKKLNERQQNVNEEWIPPQIKELYFKKEFNELTIDEKATLNLILSNNIRSIKNLKIKIIKDDGSILDPSKIELLDLIGKINFDSDDEGDVLLNQNTVQNITLESLVDQLDNKFDYYDIDADYLIILTKGVNKNKLAVLNFKLTKEYLNDGFNPTNFIEKVLEKSGIKIDGKLFIMESINDLHKEIRKIIKYKNFNKEILDSMTNFDNELGLLSVKYDMYNDLLYDLEIFIKSQKTNLFSFKITFKDSKKENKILLLSVLEKIMTRDKAVGTITVNNIKYDSGHAMAFYYCEESEMVVYCEPNQNKSKNLTNFQNSIYMTDEWNITMIGVYFVIDD